MIYTSPKLEMLGTIAGLTASDYKCTPGGDAGWTYWAHIDETVTAVATHTQIDDGVAGANGAPLSGDSFTCRPHTTFSPADALWGTLLEDRPE